MQGLESNTQRHLLLPAKLANAGIGQVCYACGKTKHIRALCMRHQAADLHGSQSEYVQICVAAGGIGGRLLRLPEEV